MYKYITNKYVTLVHILLKLNVLAQALDHEFEKGQSLKYFGKT